MPHLGSEIVDEPAMRLLSRWVARLPGEAPARELDRRAMERYRSGDGDAHKHLLSGPTGAMDLLSALESLPEARHQEAIRQALELPPGAVRDLFERFEPPGRRRERLGPSVRPERILGLKGDVARGRALYASPLLQCAKCHRVGAGPETVGPDLAEIGKKYARAQLLESLLEPSKAVDAKYAGFVVRTRSGDVLSGILVSRTEKEVVFRDVEKELRLAASDVQGMSPQQASLMPEGLLQHLTAQEAADLVAYLESLK